MHTDWLNRLHEYLICDKPLTKDVFQDNSHHHCELGKWYYSQAPSLINEYEEFNDIEITHKLMHDYARKIATSHAKDSAIKLSDYRRFIDSQSVLMQQFYKLKEKMLCSVHSFDKLTGAIRRDAFIILSQKTHNEAERYQQSYSLVMIDIDHFKGINDKYGHMAGDLVIKELAKNIYSHIRNTDSLCRFGGDEFLLLLPKISIEEAEEVMNKIHILIEKLVIYKDDNQAISMTISSGMAQWKNGMSFDDVLDLADQNLYIAKEKGRNRTVS